MFLLCLYIYSVFLISEFQNYPCQNIHFEYDLCFSDKMSPRDIKMKAAQRNVLQVGVLLVCAYAICWIVLSIMHIFIIYQTINYGDLEWNIGVILVFSNSVMNPFIYALRYDEFQEELKQIFRIKRNSQTKSMRRK